MITADGKLKFETPKAFESIWDTRKYIVLYGGRGSGKSQNTARALITKALQKRPEEAPFIILCTRALQRSMKDSVHALIASQIVELGVEHLFRVLENSIRCINGVEFVFQGLRHNINDIKSMHNVKYCWVEEAQNVPEVSWQILIPTIRVEGAQFFITFNVDFITDACYKRFIIDPPKNCVSRKVNWDENPFFPETLREEMEHLREKDYDQYLHVWEGHPILTLAGAIYASEMRKLVKENRITKVPYDPQYPVHTFWDLGWGDYTSIWLAQKVGYEIRVISFIEGRLEPVQYYLGELDSLRSKRGYVYGTHCLPHDAQSKQLSAGGITVEQQVRNFGDTYVGVPRNQADSINATRALLTTCVFDETNTAHGINHLQRYAFKVDPETGQYSQKPIHDDHSHAADAFEELAFSMPLIANDHRIPPTLHKAMPPDQKRTIDHSILGMGGSTGNLWMGS